MLYLYQRINYITNETFENLYSKIIVLSNEGAEYDAGIQAEVDVLV